MTVASEAPAVAEIRQRIRAAAADARPLCIRGAGTKDFYGQSSVGEPLDVTPMRGIVAYAPGELVITARAGTPLVELDDALTAHNQMLAFEPPRHGVGATLGGVVATGFSGPRRAQAGAVRDFVLGVRIIDGAGEALGFGGQVIKNVAGFDVSRLMVGALGTLGVLTEISLKTLPRPRAEATRVVDCGGADALRLVNAWGGKPLPVSATCHLRDRLWVRLSGAPAAIASAIPVIGGAEADGDAFWRSVRDHTHPAFARSNDDEALWRLSVRSTAPWTDFGDGQVVEWGGALRWVATRGPSVPATLRTWAPQHGGHATLYRGPDKAVGAFQPLPPATLGLHRRLKDVFDPKRVLNRGRLFDAF
ncbi:MAG: glycolate oxidase subunit GlcE [Betaproteobacteria bacterium]